MRPLISLAIALLIGFGIVALASDVLKQWSLAHYAPPADSYTPPSEARRP